ncbi:MAG: hypothetical protein P8Y03_26300 [Anaerolineales bacterium]
MKILRFLIPIGLIILTFGLAFSNAYAGPVRQDAPTPVVTANVTDPTETLAEVSPTGTTPEDTPVPGGTPTSTIVSTDSPTETSSPPTARQTDEPTPTQTRLPTQGSLRPIVVVNSYKVKPSPVAVGSNFVLNINVENQGQISAKNLVIAFTPGDFLPRDTGGVLAVSQLSPDEDKSVKQSFVVTNALQGQNIATLAASINYMDESGNAFSESFTFTIGIEKAISNGGTGAKPTPTPTATPMKRPQLVISGYQTDVSQLIPGAQFNLELKALNAGNADATRVTLIVGGAATAPSSNDSNGTLMPPGFTASGGEFTNFSPVGVSNVHFLGDLSQGDSLSATQPLIVNVSTNPGVYSLKISFAYNDEKGNLLIDDQVISLLVYSPPVVELSFYRDPGPMFANQPNILPIQIINLGRKSTVLATMRVTVENALVENNSILVGSLEAGGYFTLDANLVPNSPGPLDVQISVDYTDDFNRPQTITQALGVEVQEAPVMDPGVGPGIEPGMDSGAGIPPDMGGTETVWQKALRFLRGLVGLDSGNPQQVSNPAPGEGPIMEGPPMQ